MSVTLHVHAIDLQALRRIEGSKDEALLASLLSRGAGRLAEHDAYFAHFPQVSDYTALGEAVSQIVRGHVDPRLAPRFQFEHAVAFIVDLIGEPLAADAFAERASALWDEVDTVILRSLRAGNQPATAWPSIRILLERGPLLDVPLDPAWRLRTGYLHLDEAEAALQAAKACAPEDLADALHDLAWPDDAIDGAVQYRDWLECAVRGRKGLFFHC